MQESFSRSSVSCLINANLNSDPKEGKKSDPCWQVTQQLHHHIEKVFHFISQPNIHPAFVHVLHWDSGSGKMMQLHITFREH